ncbi:MAG TPA: hypothetical protein VIG77_15795 [Ktedonobacterales bacterium]
MARRSLASRRMTPIGAVARGALSGVAGTAVMDLVGYLRFRSGGGDQPLLDYEFSPGLKEWEQAPAPGQIGKRLFEGMLQRPLPERYAALTSDLTHWSYGAAWGSLFGLVIGSTALARGPRALAGLPFGAAVFGAAYVILPLARLYKPIWEYDKPTLAKDLSSHLVYGAGASSLFALLSRPR